MRPSIFGATSVADGARRELEQHVTPAAGAVRQQGAIVVEVRGDARDMFALVYSSL